MESQKLKDLIAEKNNRQERVALVSAGCLIDSIANEQLAIKDSTARIAQLREQLKALSVETLDADEVLGE